MPDIWVDVDTGVIVPVNILPLLDDTDFKTIEIAVVYNSAGMALTWNFVTAAGVVTGTAVTPTTAGVYDWSEPVADKGMYAIEIPASAGGSINNDTEGVGWFTGVATGVLPWRGPTIGFRRAALNDLLMDGGTASTNLEDFFDGTGYAGGTAKLTTDVTKWNGTAVTTPDTAGSPKVTITTGTGTGQVLLTSGRVKAQTYAKGAIWVDTLTGATGTTAWTHGTEATPVDRITDVTSLLASVNLRNVEVGNGSSLTLEAAHANQTFSGEKWTLALGGQSIAASHFSCAAVTGTGTGAGAEFNKCSIGTVTLPTCLLHSCGLSGTFTVSATGVYTFDQCYTEVAAGSDWVLDFAAVGATTIGLRHFAGSIEVRNMGAGDVLVVAGTGRITLTAPCAGTLHVRGTFELIPGTATTTITDTARWNEDQRLANVTLVDTLTTYTGNTVQTGDSFARIGATGSGLTTLATQASVNAIDDFVDTEITDIQARLPAALVSGRIDASVGAMAANTMTASALATDAVTEIQTGLATPTNITAGTITTVTNLTNAPTNGDLTATMKASINTEADTAIADARLDELLAADSDIDGAAPPTVGSVIHEMLTKTAGSFSYDQATDSLEAIRDRGDAAWITGSTLDAAGVRTAVGLASANLDTQLTTIDDFLDTEIAAIKAKTDLIPATPASTGDSMALTGAAVDAILDDVVEGTYTMRQLLKLFASALASKLSGAATTTVTIRDIGDTKNRIVATVDADGNRSAITLDVS